MADISSDGSESDNWSPLNVRRKLGKVKAQVIESDESDDEIVGCTSEEEEEQEDLQDSEEVIGASSEEVEDEDEDKDSDGCATEPCSPTTNHQSKGSSSGHSSEKSEVVDGSSIPDVSQARTVTVDQYQAKLAKEKEAAKLNEQKSKTSPTDLKKRLITSTPVVTGARQPSRLLDITAIPQTFSRYNETLAESDSSPEKSPSQTLPRTLYTRPPPELKAGKKNKSQGDDIEDMLVADLNNITIKGQKEFSFKPKTNEYRNKYPEGAACLDFFEEEEEEEEDSDSISANFSLDCGSKDSGNGESDIQIIKDHPPKPTTKEIVTLDDSDDEFNNVMDNLKRITLGTKASKLAAPKKTIFLNEPPPLEKKTYSYDPNNVKHQEFYGDVQRTVTMMANVLEKMPMADDEDNELVLPKGLVALFDHQQYGLRWLGWREREFPGGGILADEMGLGKTIMIIALIMKSKRDDQQSDRENWVDTEEVGSCIPSKTTLVVCPVGCILQWNDEINSKGKGLRVYLYHGQHRTTSAAQLAQYDVVLTTYHTVLAEIPKDGDARQRQRSPLKRIYWKRIVLDEAHNIRNPKTGSALAICQLKARHRWAVTGTPVHNRPEDFFSMLKFLRMKPFDDPKVWDFWIGMKAVRKSSDAHQRLQILGKALILRRTKKEVEDAGGNVKKIPPKNVETVEVELNEAERRVYDYLMQFCKNKFQEFMKNKEHRDRELNAVAMTYTAQRQKKKGTGMGDTPDDIKFSHLFALLIRLRQCAVHPHLIHTMLEEEEVDEDASFDELNDDHIVSKINPVFDRMYESTKIQKILADLDELRQIGKAEDRPMDKVIIVSSWTTTLEMIHDHLRRRKFSCVFITGKEKNTERAENMKKFNESRDKHHICLLSLMAGGVGLNLTGGNHVYILEPHWNPQLELQAQDRVHRFGQRKEVFIRRYISKETVESRILGIQEDKMALADGVLNSAKRTRGGGLAIHQLRQLFE